MGADKKARMTLVQRLLDLCSNMSGRTVRGRRLTIAVAFVLLVVAVIGAMKLRVFHDPLSWIPPERPIRVSMALADEALGGASSVQLLIKAKGAEGVKDLELQKGIERLEAHARSYDDPYSDSKLVGNFRSVVDVVRETNRALMGGAPAEYRVPDTQQAVNDRFFMVESSGPDELSRLMTLDAQVTQVTIGLRWLEATQYRPFAEHMAVGVAEHIPTDKATVSMTGTVFSFLSTVSTLLWDVIRSFGVAFLVISVLMILLLRDVRLGLIAMVPNLVPIAYILGLMGYADIPVDMANLMIASIALGIAVDDTIHLLHHYKVHYDVHRDVEAAIQHALDHTGRALVVTSIILSLGFFVYLSSAMYNLQRFGALIGLTVILALLVDLIVAPALIRTVYKSSGNTSEDESATA